MVLLLSLLVAAVHLWGLPLWAAITILWVLLPAITWMEFLAGMNFDRVKHGGMVVLPDDPEERQNQPDAAHVVRYVLWFPAALDNFILAQLAAPVYFWVAPRPWEDVGLTRLLNRMVDTYPPESRQHQRALTVRRRWLNPYDRRGVHT